MTVRRDGDLFDTPPVAGLRYAEDLIGEAEERGLIERLGALDLAPFRFHGWLGSRKTRSFGWRYDFLTLPMHTHEVSRPTGSG